MRKVNYLVVTGIMAALITLMTAYICHIPVGTNGGFVYCSHVASGYNCN